jgi:hypothetical protein
LQLHDSDRITDIIQVGAGFVACLHATESANNMGTLFGHRNTLVFQDLLARHLSTISPVKLICVRLLPILRHLDHHHGSFEGLRAVKQK